MRGEANPMTDQKTPCKFSGGMLYSGPFSVMIEGVV